FSATRAVTRLQPPDVVGGPKQSTKGEGAKAQQCSDLCVQILGQGQREFCHIPLAGHPPPGISRQKILLAIVALRPYELPQHQTSSTAQRTRATWEMKLGR